MGDLDHQWKQDIKTDKQNLRTGSSHHHSSTPLTANQEPEEMDSTWSRHVLHLLDKETGFGDICQVGIG